MTVQDTAMIEVQNLTDAPLVYISYDGKRRAFAGQQKMKVPAEELRQLGYSRGGIVLLQNYLRVNNQELAKEFNISEDLLEHEYQWNIEDVDNVLLEGSLDSLKDALDFAPAGIVDLIVDRAVALKINDIAKRKAIFESTGKNVDTMIKLVDEASTESDETEKKETPKKRRAASNEEKKSSGRRAE